MDKLLRFLNTVVDDGEKTYYNNAGNVVIGDSVYKTIYRNGVKNIGSKISQHSDKLSPIAEKQSKKKDKGREE